MLWGCALILFVVVSGIVNRTGHVPTYAQRHAAFNQLIDEFPWLKIFYVAYAAAVVIGLLYSVSRHIYFVDMLDEIGPVGFAAVLSLLGLPVGIARLLKLYKEAGEES